MRSLKLRLFAALLLATSFVWLAAVAWIYVSSRRELEHVLDTRLQEAARMVASLASGLDRTAAAGSEGTLPPLGSYERQLSCQIWSLDGRMIARSSGAPAAQLSQDAPGFSDRQIDGERWRVFTVEDGSRGVRVMVGDRVGLRERLVSDLIKGLMWPALLIAPLLGGAIWACLGQGLRPLRRMARDLASRNAEDMSPVSLARAPAEVRPLADALNTLFRRVEAARRHEREVTAFAAHELRTPLSGLKTQAQVALATEDPQVVRGALQQIVAAVDRTARLVRQLLTIARLDADPEQAPRTPVAVGPLLAEIVADIPKSDHVRVTIEPSARDLVLDTNAECLQLALRNLHENAAQHTIGGNIVWRATADGLLVEDEGRGIPPDEIDKVGTRFFRGRHRSHAGSGLGLAIVKIALSKVGAQLLIGNRLDRTGVRSYVMFRK
ncbi:ATP-binding protein [Enterovirga rhinocerotis]|uniref:histidine kinase n=1 Tax=Enterovirga rhinocerotis TaxID=1339210 RepID=A0A4R7BKV6_9HYPH|nr:sensor histidine kinase N-terminal domain-containing protein [Enterovirga rhinocerotis]TDR84496.1 two-component system sensor histidine kinase QseC [Enterovirga rhinocerotis]